MTELPEADQPDKICLHRGFQPTVSIQVFNDPTDAEDIGYMAALQIICTQCGEAFWFPGHQVGQSFTHPMVTPDGMTLLIPIRSQYTLDMPMDQLGDMAAPAKREQRELAVRRALEHPGGYALKLETENRNEWRIRAILNALEAL